MKQIRSNIFETNSSSTHSISISKEKIHKDHLPKELWFRVREFGWSCGMADPCDYLYTAIWETSTPFKYLSKIADTLHRFGIGYTFGEVKMDKWGLSNGGIDHGLDEEIVEQIVMDEERLIRYLFGETCIYTGNDNCECDDEYAKCCLAYRTVWIGQQDVENPNQDDQHEYFFKSN